MSHLGGSKEGRDKPSVIQPASSHEPAVTTSPQPPMQKPATDLLSTSGTFEKVPSPVPESFEQISLSQMQESRAPPPASPGEQSAAAGAGQLPASTPAEPPVQSGKTLIPAYRRWLYCVAILWIG